MTTNGWLQIAFFSIALLLITKPLGIYVLKVYDGSMRWLRPIERVLYRVGGVDPEEDQHWTRYAASMLIFSAASMLLTYAVLRLQHLLPLNPQAMGAVPDRQAFETAASFTTNTNWQSYSGETTMSYFSQMTQLTFHNFASAATGVALAMALARGITRHSAGRLGNFWVDLVRGTLYLFLPIATLIALLFVQQGVIQNFAHYVTVTAVEGVKQVLAMGPVASQEAIKQLGTNGGGFFNANSAHPFENPTPWSNFWQMFAIFMIPAALTYAYGRMAKNQKHGWALWAAMFVLFIAGTGSAYWAEARGNPIHASRGIDVVATQDNPGGNMEGKEVRFGIGGSTLAAVVTSNTATGSYNSMHDSYTSLGGMVLLVNMLLGELIFGGLGTGLYSMVMAAAIAVFLAGLMVGRTPEYLGKKIGPAENKMIMLYALAAPLVVLPLTAIAVSTSVGLSGLTVNSGPHGFTEILFAYTSCFANNGQSFAGLSANTLFYNLTTALAMMGGRFAVAIPVLALADLFGRQRSAPSSSGTLPTHSFVFGVLLTTCLITMVALSYLPALALGPLLERLLFGR